MKEIRINKQGLSYQILALDIGQKRIGVARAQSVARLVEPLVIINTEDGKEFLSLKELLIEWQPEILVIGLPFNKSGNRGKQAKSIEEWVAIMLKKTGFEGCIIYQDETLSSQAAQISSGKSRFIDDLAACVILEDYLNDNK